MPCSVMRKLYLYNKNILPSNLEYACLLNTFASSILTTFLNPVFIAKWNITKYWKIQPHYSMRYQWNRMWHKFRLIFLWKNLGISLYYFIIRLFHSGNIKYIIYFYFFLMAIKQRKLRSNLYVFIKIIYCILLFREQVEIFSELTFDINLHCWLL